MPKIVYYYFVESCNCTSLQYTSKTRIAFESTKQHTIAWYIFDLHTKTRREKKRNFVDIMFVLVSRSNATFQNYIYFMEIFVYIFSKKKNMQKVLILRNKQTKVHKIVYFFYRVRVGVSDENESKLSLLSRNQKRYIIIQKFSNVLLHKIYAKKNNRDECDRLRM